MAPNKDVGVFSDDELNDDVSKGLRSYLTKKFDGLEDEGDIANADVSAEWAGIMGWSKDSFPFVGPIPGLKNQYCLIGYTGHGMPRAFLSGRAVAKYIANESESQCLDLETPLLFRITKERLERLEMETVDFNSKG